MWIWFTPLLILGGLLVLFGVLALLSRIRGGRYLRPIMARLSRLPFVGRGLKRASAAALERSNPELASAMRKLERSGAMRDPQRAQRALSQLTPAERRAYMEAAKQQGLQPEPTNREQRRKLSRAAKRG